MAYSLENSEKKKKKKKKKKKEKKKTTTKTKTKKKGSFKHDLPAPDSFKNNNIVVHTFKISEGLQAIITHDYHRHTFQ